MSEDKTRHIRMFLSILLLTISVGASSLALPLKGAVIIPASVFFKEIPQVNTITDAGRQQNRLPLGQGCQKELAVSEERGGEPYALLSR